MHYGNQPAHSAHMQEGYPSANNGQFPTKNGMIPSNGPINHRYVQDPMMYNGNNHQNRGHGMSINKGCISTPVMMPQGMMQSSPEMPQAGLNQVSMVQNDMVRQAMVNTDCHSQQIEFERHRRALEQTVAPVRNHIAENELRLQESIRPYDTRPRKRKRGRSDYDARNESEKSFHPLAKHKPQKGVKATGNTNVTNMGCKRNYSEISTDVEESQAKHFKSSEDKTGKSKRSPKNKTRVENRTGKNDKQT